MRSSLVVMVATACCSTLTQADVVKYTNKAEWQSLVGAFTTITFTEIPFPPTAFITNQYSYLGVTFTDGNDALDDANSLINDGYGLYGNLPGNSITMVFAEPITSFAIDHPGFEGFKLYSEDRLLFDTGLMGGSGTGKFSGVISPTPFDSIVIQDPFGQSTLIDDLHFGPPIPAPGALALIAASTLIGQTRRRRRCA